MDNMKFYENIESGKYPLNLSYVYLMELFIMPPF